MKATKTKSSTWNLGLLYTSSIDPQIEKDMIELEDLAKTFANTYDVDEKKYLEDDNALLSALLDFEKIMEKADAKPFLYFYFLRDIDSKNELASAQIAMFQSRLAVCENKIAFFKISLGTIPGKKQRQFLSSSTLINYRVFLERVFDDAQYMLSLPEEKIMNLKSQVSYDMWIGGNEKILNQQSVLWKNKRIALSQAMSLATQMPKREDRIAMSKAVATVLKSIAPFSEAEINAIVTNKKIDDELRGFAQPFDSTVQKYRNDPNVVRQLTDTVTKRFDISHRFYELKSRLMKQKVLAYSDRVAKIGTIKTKFNFENSVSILKDTFGKLNVKFADYLDSYVSSGQIDIYPRIGKKSGAYCAGTYSNPTFVLLNHIDDLHSFTTLAHEMGHAFHGELSRVQGPLYSDYSTSLAETASTLFESIAREDAYKQLNDKERLIALHDKINDDICTIFRQIACFNFEEEIHKDIRSNGFISEKALAELHNKHMSAYLGPRFKMTIDDGYFFVSWSHIRRFFYVYSYAYGMLVSKALLRRYKNDPSFWSKIEIFLSSGGKASPEQILNEIGIDVSKSGFFEEGLSEIEDDIKELEKLSSKI
ncbi:MAG: M3 family metallopeptidase [Candidatus Paceibacterota bacterium]|jgi:oligoendopeptidase F